MNIRFTFSLIIALFMGSNVLSQDIHFSQFYQSPLNLNPALTGVMNCNQRLTFNYRNQWAALLGSNAYNTASVSYDRQMPVGQSDYFGAGITLWGDVAGASKFGTRLAKLSFSYSKQIAGSGKSAQFLTFGAEGGIAQRSVSQGDLRWPSQVSGGVFDPSSGTGELIQNANFIYPDLGAGLLWFATFDKSSAYAGAAVSHLNSPNISFLGSEVTLYRKLTAHVGGEINLTDKFSVLPNIVYFDQGPHTQINAGAAIRLDIDPRAQQKQFLHFGLWYRLGTQVAVTNDPNTTSSSSLLSDAVIGVIRFEYGNFGLGLSYDYNISSLANGSSFNGSFEISLIYLICGSSNRAVYCPTF